MQYFATPRRLALASIVLLSATPASRADEPANLLSNGGAEEVVDRQSMPSSWFAASVPVPELRLFVDRRHSRAGEACLAITNQHQYDEKVSNNWAQDIRTIPIGKTVRLSGYIRTDGAEAVNICVQCWADEGTRMVAFASTTVFRGTHGWTLAEAADLTVPRETTRMLVRAALTGKGNAWFDDVSLTITETAAADISDPYDPRMAGRIVRRLPVIKDCMVLAYLPGWNHGNVDNLAVADNNGGVRTLLAWERPSPQELERTDVRFILAMYARKAELRGEAGPIEIHKLLGDWQERTSWQNQPGLSPEAAATFDAQPGEGWKLFDVTSLVREQARAPQSDHGVAICLPAKNAARDPYSVRQETWSQIGFVSREAIGPLESKRPVLLVVRPEPSSH